MLSAKMNEEKYFLLGTDNDVLDFNEKTKQHFQIYLNIKNTLLNSGFRMISFTTQRIKQPITTVFRVD